MFAGEARGPDRRRAAGCGRRPLQPLYNYMDDLPGISGTPVPFLPKRYVARTGPQHELRRRPRLPVPVLLLHDHQRPGPQVALPPRGRRRAARADELGPGHPQVLHHRRQLRPQPGLGDDLRPADRAAREGGHPARPDDPGRHAVPQDPALHREGEARRRHPGVHRPREHQPRQPARAPRSGRTRSPNTARCCWPGRRTGS